MPTFNRQYLANSLFWLFLCFLPTQLGTFFFMDFSYVNGVRVDYLAPALYLTDILFFMLVAFFGRHIYSHIRNNSVLYICGISLVSINVVLSQYPFLALYWVLKYCEMLLVFIIARSVKLPKLTILSAFATGAFVQLILTLIQFTQKASVQGVFYYIGERSMSLTTPGIAKASLFGTEILRPYGTFSHPNSLAGFYVLLYSFILTYKTKSLLKPILLILSTLLVLISFSKLTILTFIIITIAYSIMNSHKQCIPCTLAKFSALLVVATVFLQAHSDPFSLEKRIGLFKDSLASIIHHPFFGTGFGHHLFEQPSFTGSFSYFFLQPVHNVFLLFATQAGLLISLFCVYCGYLFFKKQSVRALQYALLPLGVIFITGLGDHYWLSLQQNMLLMPVILGVALQRQKG